MPRATETTGTIRGMRLGHAKDEKSDSGVTAVVFDAATPTVVDHRGGASATYDIASLGLDATFGRRWAIFFSGGSIFGLDAAAGVRHHLVEAGAGHAVFHNPHRLAPVSGAALFDLPPAIASLPDYRALGYTAARRASTGPVEVGRVGAGAGATVGKYRGRASAMFGGIGWHSRALAHGRVGVLIALNAVGGVRDPATGTWVAGARGPGGRVVAPSLAGFGVPQGTNTTLSLLVTDLDVDRPTLQRAASMAHVALGSVIVPFHSATDGDVMFAAATGVAGAPPREERAGGSADALGVVAATAAVAAALGAARSANGPV